MASIIGLPVGYRFHPTDQEIVNHFLTLKMLGVNSEVQMIKEVDVCKWEPWELPRFSGVESNDPEWYFFCPRDFKFANGRRTNRATKTGYWKVTGKDRKIKIPGTNEIIGIKKTLVFYEGRVSNSVRTTWVMHEYHPNDIIRNERSFVICRLKKKPDEQNQDSVFRNFVAEETITEIDTPPETNLEFIIESPFQSLDYMFQSALQPQQRVQEENESSFFANCLNGVQLQISTDEHDDDLTQFLKDLDCEETNSQMNFAVETDPNVIDMLSDTQMGSWRRDYIEDSVFDSDTDTELAQAWFGHVQEAPNLVKEHASSNQYQQMRMVRTPFGNPTSSIHEQYKEGKNVLRDDILEMDASSVGSEADRPFEINCLELVPQELPAKVTPCKPKYKQSSYNMAIGGVAPSCIESNERLSGIASTKDKGGEAAKHGTVVDLSPKTTLLRSQSNPLSEYFVNVFVGVVLFVVVLRELVLVGQWC